MASKTLAPRASKTSTALASEHNTNAILGGRAKEKTANTIKIIGRRKTDSVSFDFEFKNFWKILAQQNAAYAAESHFCTVWRELQHEARLLTEKNNTTVL